MAAKKHKMEQVPAGQLRVDPKIQRAEEVAHVNRLAREWNDDYVGTLVGSRRKDGNIYLLDGQQRWLAMTTRKNNYKYLFDVKVYENLTTVEEANMFQGFNKGRKAVAPYANHLVSLEAQNPVALAIEEVVTDLGFSTGARSHGKTVGCISLMYRILEKKGSNIVDQKYFLGMALSTSYEIYGKTGDPFRGDIVEGLAIFWAKHWNDPNIDQAVLIKKVASKYTVSQLLAASRARAVGNNRPTGEICKILEETYNWKRGNGSKLAVA